MAALGLAGPSSAPPGSSPTIRPVGGLLRRHGLRCVGGFTALVLHEAELDVTAARRAM